MRFVSRNRVRPPDVLNSRTALSFVGEVNEYLSRLDKERRPPKPPEMVLKNPQLASALRELFGGCCAYCETKIPHGEEQIDHFRPSSGAQGAYENVDFAHYIWLAVEWQNLFLACPACLRAKRNLFPAQERGRISAKLSELRRRERGTILDPCNDHAFGHFTLSNSGHLRQTSERGNTTIQVLDLNREALVRDRQRCLDLFREALENYDSNTARDLLLHSGYFGGTLWLWVLDRIPNAVARKVMHLQKLAPHELAHILKQAEQARFEQSVPNDPGYATPRLGEGRFIRRITVWNFRGIQNAKLEFPEHFTSSSQFANSVIVLGDNASGKTTLLQAAALGSLGPTLALDAGISPDWCLSKGKHTGEILVEFWDTDDCNHLTFREGDKIFGGSREVPVLVLGYGAYRLPARGKLSTPKVRYDYRIQSLFSERELVSGAIGLVKHLQKEDGRVDKGRLEDASRTLNAMFQGRAKASLDKHNRIVVSDSSHTQLLNELSSGYKSIVALTADIMDVMFKVWDGMTSGQALILIDEIDAHLHPTWRLAIVDALRDAFPMSQFIMTTHDPLPLRGLKKEEVKLLEKGDEATALSTPTIPGLSGMSIDQLLTSDLFGLISTVSTQEAELLSRYYGLLALQDPTDAEKEELAETEEHLGSNVPFGNTMRERLLFRAVDRFLASHQKTEAEIGEADLDDLLEEVEKAQQEILAKDGTERA